VTVKGSNSLSVRHLIDDRDAADVFPHKGRNFELLQTADHGAAGNMEPLS
jgi:hypothetical protein